MSISTRRNPAILSVAVVAAGGVAGWILVPTRSSKIELGPKTRAVADQSARTLADLDGFVEMSDPESVRASFRAADVQGPSDVSASDLEAIRLEACFFVTKRLAPGASPNDYLLQRLASGYRVNSDFVLDQVWELPKLFKIRTNQPPPANRAECFRILAKDDLGQEGPENRPVRIASDGRGVLLSFGRLDRSNPAFGTIDGYFPREVWQGMVSSTHLPMLVPPADVDELLVKHGSIRYCAVAFVVENAKGERYPMVLMMTYDPVRSAWFVQHVNVNNTTARVPLILH